jgi:hypothetical protein
VTVVNRDTFVNARPVSQGMIHVNAQQIDRARVVESNPIAPTRTSYVGATARVSTARPAVPIAQRPVVVRLNPAVGNPNRTGNVYTNDSRQFNQPARTTPPQQQQPSREGFRPFTPPGGANQNVQPTSRGNQNQNTQPPNQPNGRGNQNQTFNQQQKPNQVQQPAPKPNQNYNLQQNNQQNQNFNQQQQQQRNFRYAPQPKARDNMYDVHPPLNQNQNQAHPQAQPRPQPQQKSAPAHTQESHGGGGGKTEKH